MVSQLTYLSGFNNEHETESLPNAYQKGNLARRKLIINFTLSSSAPVHLPRLGLKIDAVGLIEFGLLSLWAIFHLIKTHSFKLALKRNRRARQM